MKDASRLVAYLVGTVFLGCLLAPPLFWATQAAGAHGILSVMATFEFDSVFHRALLIAGLLLLWPLMKSAQLRREDLALVTNVKTGIDLVAGFVLAAIPLLLCGAALLVLKVYSVRVALSAHAIGGLLGATLIVPLIEEIFFRGIILGMLLRSMPAVGAAMVSAAIFSTVHFLKSSEQTTGQIGWSSGYNSLTHSFSQFGEPMLIVGAFSTLFLIGLVLAHARIRTRALWLSIGLHAGWIFGNGIFNRLGHRRMIALPWLGRNLLVGLVPLGVCLLTWSLVWLFLQRRSRGTQTC